MNDIKIMSISNLSIYYILYMIVKSAVCFSKKIKISGVQFVLPRSPLLRNPYLFLPRYFIWSQNRSFQLRKLEHQKFIFIEQMERRSEEGLEYNGMIDDKEVNVNEDEIELRKSQQEIDNLLKQNIYDKAVRLSKEILQTNNLAKLQQPTLRRIYMKHAYAAYKTKGNINQINLWGDEESIKKSNELRKGKKSRFTYKSFLFFGILGAILYNWYKGATSEGGPAKKRPTDLFIESFLGRDDIQSQTNIQTRFTDVLGIDQFKQQLTELVDYLKNPTKYTSAGAKLPKGILLIGAPGTGKTLLARALAGEAGCNFFYKSGAQFDQMFVGTGARRIRKLFEKARSMAPSIIFIDEIDSLAGRRNPMDSSHTRDSVNQLLAQMDGFKPTENVVVVAATNFEAALDPAIKRPGRFDKIIHIPLPDIRGRTSIFQYYMKKIKFDPSQKFQELAQRTVGFSGADIQNMVNIAILNSVRNKRVMATKEDFEYSFDRIKMGIGRKSTVMTEQDKKAIAYHEIGHALTSILTEGSVPLHKVTILPRGSAKGFTSMIPTKDNLSQTKKSIIAKIDVSLGGRASEELFLGLNQITAGCSDDLQKATQNAFNYVKFLGMKEDLTLISPSQSTRISDQYNYEIENEIDTMLKESYYRVKTLLKKNEKKVHQLVQKLIKEEILTAEQIKQILKA